MISAFILFIASLVTLQRAAFEARDTSKIGMHFKTASVQTQHL